jgi:3-oxoacyl-[acyl-carrier-protein] synthase-1
MNRVCITGIGIISTIGLNCQEVAASLQQGRSGIVHDAQRSELGFASPLTGQITGFESGQYLTRKQRKTMPEHAIQAYTACQEAIIQSGLEPADLANDMAGLIFGNDSSCLGALEQTQRLTESGETRLIGSGAIFKSMTSSVTMNLNTILKTQGACWTVSGACSSGGHALGQAFDLISMGRQNLIICGGAQEINWQSICGFDGLGAFSQRTHEPQKACRPFDMERDGLVPSGGAAAVVLENRDQAIKRGAAVLGEVLAYGFSSDGNHISVPSSNGLARAMTAAIDQARLKPADIDYLCAHATSTPQGDKMEALNILSVFGGHSPYISSTKSMTGHEFWMSGASQVVYSALMAWHGFMAPNVNLENPDPDFRDLNLLADVVNQAPKRVMCNSAGFGGTNSCIILGF